MLVLGVDAHFAQHVGRATAAHIVDQSFDHMHPAGQHPEQPVAEVVLGGLEG